MTKKRGLFITVEGIEGVGKTTAMQFLQHWLEHKGIDFLQTREPGGTLIAEQIRHLFLKKQIESIHADTELLLVFAARAQHLQNVILPAMAEGKWVICDRFTDATYAYQGGGRGMDVQRIELIENWVQNDFRPDCILLLDAPIEVCLDRAKKRGALDRIESEKTAFFVRARNAYLQRATAAPDRYRIVDASLPIQQVQENINHILDQLWEQHHHASKK